MYKCETMIILYVKETLIVYICIRTLTFLKITCIPIPTSYWEFPSPHCLVG